MVDSLRDRLAATLAAHRPWDEVEPWLDTARRIRWTCSCGFVGEWQPWTVDRTHTTLADMRAHQAGKLAEAVAEWLDRRADPHRRGRATWAKQHQIESLEQARDDIRAEVTE